MPDFGPRWKWVRNLSEGGQAHTFVVQRKDAADSHEYVLKRLKNLKRLDRFEREIEVCTKFQHPNVLTIVDRGEARRKPFLVTEYCAGGSLADHPRPVGAPVLSVLETFRQVCAGVAYAQERGIAHRDIKPDNIYLREDGTAVLGDFGICFVDDDGRLTMTHEVAGSRFYCAPELRDGRLEDGVPQKAADVYSLGKVLYWMMSGGRIFDREEHRETKYCIGQDDLLNPAYELINQLLDKTIVHRWSDRIGTASKLLVKVEELMRIVAAGGHALTLSVPHRCMFCARGAYKPVVDMTRPLPAGGATNQGIRQMQDSNSVRNFGFTFVGAATWIILACDICGHILTFRPDLAALGGLQNWKRN